MGEFNGLKKMWQVGNKMFPAGNAAEAMKIKQAGEVAGHFEPGRALVQVEHEVPVANELSKGMEKNVPKSGMVAGVGMMGTGMDVDANPLSAAKDLFKKYQENVTDPAQKYVSDSLKKTLTPDIDVRGQQYKTSSPGSDMIIDGATTVATDPTYTMGGMAGGMVGAAQLASELAPEPKDPYKNTRSLWQK